MNILKSHHAYNLLSSRPIVTFPASIVILPATKARGFLIYYDHSKGVAKRDPRGCAPSADALRASGVSEKARLASGFPDAGLFVTGSRI